MKTRDLEKIFLWAIKIGLWVIPFLPLYVSSSMLFPFITGKNFTFRIIVEIIFALWVGLVILKPEFRPRLTPLFKAVTVFMAILLLADILSPNPYRAFFSNYERMEGFMMLFHLYLYFIILSSVFTKRDWTIFFHFTLLASLVVSYIAFLQKLGLRPSLQGGYRVDSTIGNPTYLAAYLLFHIWLLVMLIYQFWKKRWVVYCYSALLIFELAILYFTATRGAVLALLTSSILFAASIVIFWPKVFPPKPAVNVRRPNVPATPWPRGRKLALSALAIIILAPIVFWQIRATGLIESQILDRLTSYSFQERTIKSRFMVWGMSFKAALERPILGWGQENYYLVFQKYFNPGLYGQEPWFDRSHNVIFDWLIHTGFLGLLSYLSIIGVVIFTLWYGMRKGFIQFWQGLALSALFITHFLQNIFVFDNLNTYLLFFAFLAYGDFLRWSPYGRSPVGRESAQEVRSGPAEGRTSVKFSLAGVVVFVLLVAVAWGGYFLHFKPISESKALIRALQLQQVGSDPLEVKAAFEKALAYGTFGDTEVREQLGNMARSIAANPTFTPAKRKEFLDFAISELRKEVEHPAKDVKHALFLGVLLSRGGQFGVSYLQEAERVLQEAIRLSPTKQVVYFELAQLYLNTGNAERAIELLQKAWDLDRSYQEAGSNLLLVALISGKTALAEATAKEIDFSSLPQEILRRLGDAYGQRGYFKEALEIYKGLVSLSPSNVDYRRAYASLLGRLGRAAEARREAEEVLRLNPELEKEVQEFLKGLPL